MAIKQRNFFFVDTTKKKKEGGNELNDILQILVGGVAKEKEEPNVPGK